jgi:hypothetical protein
MTPSQIPLPPAPKAGEKLKGPASYFPSIEKTYGKPVAHWFGLLEGSLDLKHMEQVDWLKSEHGIGHGHANALVAYFRKSQGL